MSHTSLYNQSKRKITFAKLDGTTVDFLPGKALSIENPVAHRLRKLYTDELVAMEDMQQKFEPSQAPVSASQAELAASVSAPAAPLDASIEKLGPLSTEEKSQVVIQLTEALKKLRERGMSVEEIDAMAQTAASCAHIGLAPAAPTVEQIQAGLEKLVDQQAKMAAMPADEAPEKKRFFSSILSKLS